MARKTILFPSDPGLDLCWFETSVWTVEEVHELYNHAEDLILLNQKDAEFYLRKALYKVNDVLKEDQLYEVPPGMEKYCELYRAVLFKFMQIIISNLKFLEECQIKKND